MMKKATFIAVLVAVIEAGVASAHPGHPIDDGFALHNLGGLVALLFATTAALAGSTLLFPTARGDEPSKKR